MESILYNEYFFSLLIGGLVFLACFLSFEKVYAWYRGRTVDKRGEILSMLKGMLVETDEKRLNIMLFAMSFGLGAVMFLLMWPNFLPATIAFLIFSIAGWYIPALVVKNMYEKRCDRFVEQLVDGLTIMGNGVKAGRSLTQTMDRVIENMPNPIAAEFRVVLEATRIGQTVEEALGELGNRIPRPDVQMLVTSVNILRETGGNLAETFETIVKVIRERQKVEKKILSMTQKGKTQGMIVGAVPFIMLALFTIFMPDVANVLYTTTIGWFILLGVLFLVALAGFMIKKIVTIEV